jgi:protein involved in ribonucleotide reduction
MKEVELMPVREIGSIVDRHGSSAQQWSAKFCCCTAAQTFAQSLQIPLLMISSWPTQFACAGKTVSTIRTSSQPPSLA